MMRHILLHLVLVFFTGTCAFANVTASVRGIQISASELSSPGQGVVVHHEKLVLVCHEADCNVTARYQVRSGADVTADLEFITDMPPVDGSGNKAVVTSGSAVRQIPLIPKQVFTAHLKKGENTIEIAYRHRVARNLVEPAYFNSYSLDYITYDLWPLKGWTLANDFSLDLEFYDTQESLGLFNRLTGGTYRQVVITGWDKVTGKNDIAAPAARILSVVNNGWTDSRYHLRWQTRFNREFPDRLLIFFAPQDEIDRFASTGRWSRSGK